MKLIKVIITLIFALSFLVEEVHASKIIRLVTPKPTATFVETTAGILDKAGLDILALQLI